MSYIFFQVHPQLQYLQEKKALDPTSFHFATIVSRKFWLGIIMALILVQVSMRMKYFSFIPQKFVHTQIYQSSPQTENFIALHPLFGCNAANVVGSKSVLVTISCTTNKLILWAFLWVIAFHLMMTLGYSIVLYYMTNDHNPSTFLNDTYLNYPTDWWEQQELQGLWFQTQQHLMWETSLRQIPHALGSILPPTFETKKNSIMLNNALLGNLR